MPSTTTRPRNLLRTDLLGWLCFLTLLTGNICNTSAPADSREVRAANSAGGPPCPSDIAPPGGDGHVDVLDLLAIINDWGACPKDPPPPVCDPDGQWLTATAISHTCGLLLHYNIAGWQFSQSGDTLLVEPLGVQGDLPNMTGPATDCEPGNSFTVTGTEPGGCDVTCTLSGTFTTENQFSGTFIVSFSGSSCGDCFTQTYNITATR